MGTGGSVCACDRVHRGSPWDLQILLVSGTCKEVAVMVPELKKGDILALCLAAPLNRHRVSKAAFPSLANEGTDSLLGALPRPLCSRIHKPLSTLGPVEWHGGITTSLEPQIQDRLPSSG